MTSGGGAGRSSLYQASDRERLAAEDRGEDYRDAFRRDYARVLHCPAFRRLQGKTQLFPGFESDFFRNRLTHSLEVAQIAKSIGLFLNKEHSVFRDESLDLDLLEFAGLAHDLGHPPFGHNGERALDRCMRESGGFEGNAQTFRILSRLEKKHLDPDAQSRGAEVCGIDDARTDLRRGLNLTARALAAILKYDKQIPVSRPEGSKVCKGYYAADASTVEAVKDRVLRGNSCASFKTVECSLMDVADDIAYSTYDLEDAFKAGFLSPLELLALDGALLRKVAERVEEAIGTSFSEDDARDVVVELFTRNFSEFGEGTPDITKAVETYKASLATAAIGYMRTKFTSELVGEFISGVEVDHNAAAPQLSRVRLRSDTHKKVETLKHITFQAIINSSRVKVAEYRGDEIVAAIFKALAGEGGASLLPPDFFTIHERVAEQDRRRVVCDFIAGMTDSYAIEFYARLKSENAKTIFRPL